MKDGRGVTLLDFLGDGDECILEDDNNETFFGNVSDIEDDNNETFFGNVSDIFGNVSDIIKKA